MFGEINNFDDHDERADVTLVTQNSSLFKRKYTTSQSIFEFCLYKIIHWVYIYILCVDRILVVAQTVRNKKKCAIIFKETISYLASHQKEFYNENPATNFFSKSMCYIMSILRYQSNN